jgi:hypothetical protein
MNDQLPAAVAPTALITPADAHIGVHPAALRFHTVRSRVSG